jgi:hypothetical protein
MAEANVKRRVHEARVMKILPGRLNAVAGAIL